LIPTPNCPHCGQRMPQLRCGVKMYPMTAAIFDLIKAAGREGIGGRALFTRAYAGIHKPSYRALKAHVCHAREALRETEYRIICEHNGSAEAVYRLVKVVAVKAFEGVPSRAV
jgi:hypothetical protein